MLSTKVPFGHLKPLCLPSRSLLTTTQIQVLPVTEPLMPVYTSASSSLLLQLATVPKLSTIYFMVNQVSHTFNTLYCFLLFTEPQVSPTALTQAQTPLRPEAGGVYSNPPVTQSHSFQTMSCGYYDLILFFTP